MSGQEREGGGGLHERQALQVCILRAQVGQATRHDAMAACMGLLGPRRTKVTVWSIHGSWGWALLGQEGQEGRRHVPSLRGISFQTVTHSM